ncbi:hypothetical protein K438DRAFT_1984640 [Mycena galopus ATCC 62051]|nr:hypothetical protein K438DRAFT_1984640 [Mycena galopus ATCC 62051]
MSTTQTYTMRSPLPTPTSGSGSITLSPSLATSTSLSTSSSMASPSISTSTSTTSAARVRFDAECVLIPELGSFNPKRPRMVTKSYSLPLWKKNTRDEEDEQHVVLKLQIQKILTLARTQRLALPASRLPAAPVLPALALHHFCVRGPLFTTGSVTLPWGVLRRREHATYICGHIYITTEHQRHLLPNANAILRRLPRLSPPLTERRFLSRLPTPTPRPLPALSLIYTSPIQSTSSTVSAPLSSSPSNAAAHARTVPLRPCCPECAAGAKMEVLEEAFTRGALRVRRRAASLAGAFGGGGDALYEAARQGGFLDVGPAAAVAAEMIMDGMGGDGGALMSGTGLAQVNRLVAELDRRRSRSTTPTPPVSPLDPHGHGHGGRASPSLLGPALARLADDASGGAHEYGERLLPGDALGHGHGRNSGRTSPLLPLGIAVDEVDKERRRRSEDSGVLGGVGMSVEMLLAEEDELYEDSEREGGDGEGAPRSRSATPSPKILYERAYSSSPTGFLSAAPPASAPPTSTSFPASSSITSVQLPASAIKNLKRRSFNAPVRGYVDDDDAELFPLPSSSSRGSTPTVSPRGSPAASASEVNVVNADGNGKKRGSPKAGALLPAALTAAARERDVAGGSGKEGTTPPSPREKEKEKERSRSEAVCIALGTGGRREREEREREREREKAAKCSRGLLLPPGDGRECSDSSNSASRESSREGSVERGVARGRGGGGGSGSTSDADSERRDVDKPLPVLPHLATSVLTAGRYSPALAPRTSKAVQDAAPGQGKSSSHVRVASAPAGGSPTSSSFKPSTSPAPPTPTISTSTSAHLGRAKSASTSSPTTPTSSTSTAVAAPTPGGQILARVSSLKGKRTRSSSSSSAGKSGRKAFGALVDVLKGVTSISNAGSAGVAAV